MDKWYTTVLGSIPYKNPMLLGGKEVLELTDLGVDLDKNKVRIGFFFVKPGRQYYVLRHNKKAYVIKELVRCREEPIPHCK